LSWGQKDGPWPPPELPPALPPWADPEARADAPLTCCSAGLALALTDGEGEELDPAEALAAGLGFAALRDWSDPVVAGAALDADGLADAAADAEAAGLVVGVGLVASAGCTPSPAAVRAAIRAAGSRGSQTRGLQSRRQRSLHVIKTVFPPGSVVNSSYT
jgi:hypothetical protein